MTGTTPPTGERILHTALALAEERGWDTVRLCQVAEHLDISLSDVRNHYRDLDAIANAWFETGLRAMLTPDETGFADLPPHRRLRASLIRWLDALAPHRRVTAQMVLAKAYPFHMHHWVPMVFNLSRLIHWWLDAAGIVSKGRRRQAEEILLTAVFLAVFARWVWDSSPGQDRSKWLLARRLAAMERMTARIPG